MTYAKASILGVGKDLSRLSRYDVWKCLLQYSFWLIFLFDYPHAAYQADWLSIKRPSEFWVSFLLLMQPPASFITAMEEYVKDAPRVSSVRKEVWGLWSMLLWHPHTGLLQLSTSWGVITRIKGWLHFFPKICMCVTIKISITRMNIFAEACMAWQLEVRGPQISCHNPTF